MKGYIKQLAFLLLAALLLAACQRNTKYPYAIRDFDADVQPLLESLASNGILNNNGLLEMELQGKLSKKELKKLSTCDVPLLRAFALESLLTTGEFLTIKTDITFGHLDDTACVAIDMGEFGILRYLVSDFVIMTFRTNSTVDSVLENRLIHELFTQRPYLRTTYSIQPEKVSRLPNGYQLIRNIVEHKCKPVQINEPIEGGEAEEMLLRLAAFRQPADSSLIRERLEHFLEDWYNDGAIYSGKSYVVNILKKYAIPEYAEPVKRLTDVMITYTTGLEGDKYFSGDYEYEELTLEDYFTAIAAQRNNHGKQQLARLLRHYQELALDNESLYRTFSKEALSKLKSFIAKSDYADYKSLL